MAQRYIRISTFPENLYVNTAPVLISAGALLKDNKTGKVLAQFKFKNLSDNIITAVKLSIRSYDISGVELVGVEEYQYLDVSVKPTESFGDDKAIVLPDTNTRNCAVIIKEVVFAGIAPWKNDNSAECDSIPSQVPLKEVLNNSGLFEQYKRDTTEQSKYKPAKHLDLWLCSCGTANKHYTKKCSNCKIELHRLLEATNLERLAKNYKVYQGEQEKAVKAKLEAKNKERKTAIFITICALLLLVVVWFITNVFVPRMKYNAAKELLTQGKYQEAISEFEAMDDYKDSELLIKQAQHQINKEKLKTAEAGEYIIFGAYEQDNQMSNGKEDIQWLILEREENKILVISRYCLDYQPFNKTYSTVTWKSSTLRQWLNNDFFNTAFTEDEQLLISTTTVYADSYYDGHEAERVTEDKMFVLSLFERSTYEVAETGEVTKYAKAQRTSSSSDWWLRTIDDNMYKSHTTLGDGAAITRDVNKEAAVRPAMWIDLSNLE